jgi:hypothetical protein
MAHAAIVLVLASLALTPPARSAAAQVRDSVPARDTTTRTDTLMRRPPGDTAVSTLQRLGIDRLRLSSIGVAYGVAKPVRAESTDLYALYADYGEIAPRWHVLFGASWWRSRMRDEVVQRFADSIRAVVDDPTGDAVLQVGPVRTSTLALTVDARYSPRRGRRLRPYVGGGIGAYAVNVEGPPISGTFVENSLDNINAGFAVHAGLDVRPFPNLAIDMHARYDLLSGSRYGSLRAGAAYIFSAGGRT